MPWKYFITGLKVQGHSKMGGETLFSRAKLSGCLDSVPAQGRVVCLNGYEHERAPGDSGGWGSPACCSPWGHKDSVSN